METVRELMDRDVLVFPKGEDKYHDYVIDGCILDPRHGNIHLMSGARHWGAVTLEEAHSLLDGYMLDMGKYRIGLVPCFDVDNGNGWYMSFD